MIRLSRPIFFSLLFCRFFPSHNPSPSLVSLFVSLGGFIPPVLDFSLALFLTRWFNEPPPSFLGLMSRGQGGRESHCFFSSLYSSEVRFICFRLGARFLFWFFIHGALVLIIYIYFTPPPPSPVVCWMSLPRSPHRRRFLDCPKNNVTWSTTDSPPNCPVSRFGFGAAPKESGFSS